jgi:hypothetical protein
MLEAKANTCGCAAGPSAPPRSGRLTARCCLVLSVGFAALVPKCPMCLAAYLSLVGLGGGLAVSTHPFMRPVSVGLVAVAALIVLLQQLRTKLGPSRTARAGRAIAQRAARGPLAGE